MRATATTSKCQAAVSTPPPLDPFGKELFIKEPKRTLKQLAEDKSLSKEKALDNLLLVLFDALLLAQSEDWSRKELGNLTADETYELARWFALGQNVSRNPIFDGICSMCGALLHGIQNKSSALSNKCSAPPCDRDGKTLMTLDGVPLTHAQPPFLLRYSPQLFAREAPEMFVYDANTNSSYVQLLDARTMKRQAKAILPVRSPFLIHASYFTKDDI